MEVSWTVSKPCPFWSQWWSAAACLLPDANSAYRCRRSAARFPNWNRVSNARLLTRSTRRLVLTDAGAAYVAASKRILEQVAEAERAASGSYATPRGDLVITAPIVFGRLLPVVADFLQRWPEINVRLVLSDRNLHLIDDRVDIAVRIGALADSALAATKVGAVRRVVCGSPAYFAAHGVPRRPADLRPLMAVTFDPFPSSEHWIFPNPKSKREIRVPVRSRLSRSIPPRRRSTQPPPASELHASCPIKSLKPFQSAESESSSRTMSLSPRRSVSSMAVRD